jgi:hypothetical protein
MRFNINTNIGTHILSCTIKEEKESYHLYYEIVYPYFVSKGETVKHSMSWSSKDYQKHEVLGEAIVIARKIANAMLGE